MSPEQVAGPGFRQLPLLAWLVLVWMFLWGTWSWANLLSGILVAVVLSQLLPLPPVTEHARFRPLAVLSFTWYFLSDLAISSVVVAWEAVRPSGPVRSALIEVQLRTDSDLLLTLIAETLTLVPGSLVLDLDRNEKKFLMHVMPVRTEEDVDKHRASVHEVEERLVKAFGSAREIAALDAPLPTSQGEAGR